MNGDKFSLEIFKRCDIFFEIYRVNGTEHAGHACFFNAQATVDALKKLSATRQKKAGVR
jgi:hypothetical protein